MLHEEERMPEQPEPLCTCGHPDSEHYAGYAFCKTCGHPACTAFQPVIPLPEPAMQEQYPADRWLIEFPSEEDRPELHSTFEKAIETKLRLLYYPPRTDEEILAAVTLFSDVKDKVTRLDRLIDGLVRDRSIPNRRVLLHTLLAGLLRFVDWLDEYGRVSQAQAVYQKWEPWMNTMRLHVYQGLVLRPSNDLAVALVALVRLLDDRTHWPAFAQAHETQPSSKRPRNPKQAFANDMRSDLRRFRLIREVENDILLYMGFVSGEPTKDVD
jgi:hypothetical protein